MTAEDALERLLHYKFPLTWNGRDVQDANGRIIVWSHLQDHDDVAEKFGYFVVEILNDLFDREQMWQRERTMSHGRDTV